MIQIELCSPALKRQRDDLRGVVVGYAPLLACSVIGVKGSGHFTGL